MIKSGVDLGGVNRVGAARSRAGVRLTNQTDQWPEETHVALPAARQVLVRSASSSSVGSCRYGSTRPFARSLLRSYLVRVKDLISQFGSPESESSRRTISVPAVANAALRDHKARQAREHARARFWADNGLIFCTQLGTPLLRRNVNRSFSTALKRAGLPPAVRFQDLRHAHATLMFRAGVPLNVASGRLGHGSTAITADLYQHWAVEMDMDAAERAASAMQVSRSSD
jgi:hypothetical protein